MKVMNPMSASIFIRASEDEKDILLYDGIMSLNSGASAPNVYYTSTLEFLKVPLAPFAYQISNEIRETFVKLAPLESKRRSAKQGLATADDFRFVRLFWETERLTRDSSERVWFPFAKGGHYSPFYADVYLEVNWRGIGREIRCYGDANGVKPKSRPQNVDYYFRPGLTWPLRTQSGLGMRVMPKGCVFGHKGPVVFCTGDNETALLSTLAMLTSSPFRGLVELQMTFGSYEVGTIQRTPLPGIDSAIEAALSACAKIAWESARLRDTANLTSHAFILPALIRNRARLGEAAVLWGERLEEAESAIADARAQIDDVAFKLYDFGSGERQVIERLIERQSINGQTRVRQDAISDIDAREEEEPAIAESTVDSLTLTVDLVDYIVGTAFGRWDVRFATGEKPELQSSGPFDLVPSCPPGMLQNEQGLPILEEELPKGYPAPFPWDGILVDDPNHSLDIERRIRLVLEVIWGEHASEVEREICTNFGVMSLREYMRKIPGFFTNHLKLHSKSRRQAPIYWPLSTASGNYTLWLYCHRFTKDTLYKALEHVKEKVAHEEQQQAEQIAEAGPSPSADWHKTLTAQADFVAELRSFNEELARVAPLWNPDLDDGVSVNYSLLWRMIAYKPWQKTVKACWDELAAGKNDWARLAMHLWPDRVVPKCAKDRSLAIAHGLDGIFWAKGADGKWAARAIPLKSTDSIVQARITPAVNTALRSLTELQTVSGTSRVSSRRKATSSTNRK